MRTEIKARSDNQGLRNLNMVEWRHYQEPKRTITWTGVAVVSIGTLVAWLAVVGALDVYNRLQAWIGAL